VNSDADAGFSEAARAVAVRFLQAVTAHGARLDQLASFGPFLRLDPRDRAFVKELTHGILRNRSLLDYYIGLLSERPLARLDPVVSWILRLGLYELEFLRTPDRAAVFEAVELSRTLQKPSAASFVNALLRRFLREKPALLERSSNLALSVRYSHPEWLAARYLDRFGPERAEALMARNNRPPLPAIRVNPFKTDLEHFRRKLEEHEIVYEESPGPPDCLIVRSPAFSQHPLYLEGYCFFMDIASQEVAWLADVESAEILGDLCAAPGGKAFILAARKRHGSALHCADISWGRIELMRGRADLMGVERLIYSVGDLTKPVWFRPVFDFLLVDVPCSGLGTIRTNPDIRWKIRMSHLKRLKDRQISILTNAFSALQPGGRLLYSTCSTEPEENEEVVEAFLASEPKARLVRPYYRTFPEDHAGDCFFAVEIRHG
jgi:16S rRNA (cytosine967-C5)-methyltransferase